MAYKKLSEIREDLGIKDKKNKGDYTLLSLSFQMDVDAATRYILMCKKRGISVSQYARELILKDLASKD